MTVNVYPARGVSPHLVTETLSEAGAVWNDAGITLSWRVVPAGRPRVQRHAARCHQRRPGTGSAAGPNADRMGGIPSSRRARPGDPRVARQRDEAAATVRWTRPFGRSHAAGRDRRHARPHARSRAGSRARTLPAALQDAYASGLMRTGRAVPSSSLPAAAASTLMPPNGPPSSPASRNDRGGYLEASVASTTIACRPDLQVGRGRSIASARIACLEQRPRRPEGERRTDGART